MAQRFRCTARCKSTFFYLVFELQKHANFDAKQGKTAFFAISSLCFSWTKYETFR
jgi:hypothetical protein